MIDNADFALFIHPTKTFEDLVDYKFFCFSGKPEFCQVISDRSVDEKIDFYDMGWQRIEGLIGLNPKAHNSSLPLKKPASFELMKNLVEEIASYVQSAFVRIDFYEVGSHPYFGEITFYPMAGFGKFSPDHWNELMGEKIHLDFDD